MRFQKTLKGIRAIKVAQGALFRVRFRTTGAASMGIGIRRSTRSASSSLVFERLNASGRGGAA